MRLRLIQSAEALYRYEGFPTEKILVTGLHVYYGPPVGGNDFTSPPSTLYLHSFGCDGVNLLVPTEQGQPSSLFASPEKHRPALTADLVIRAGFPVTVEFKFLHGLMRQPTVEVIYERTDSQESSESASYFGGRYETLDSEPLPKRADSQESGRLRYETFLNSLALLGASLDASSARIKSVLALTHHHARGSL